MRISAGIDIAREKHWVAALDADGAVRIDRELLNPPAEIASLADQLTAPGEAVRIGIDVIGGIAGLAEAMLAQAGDATWSTRRPSAWRACTTCSSASFRGSKPASTSRTRGPCTC